MSRNKEQLLKEQLLKEQLLTASDLANLCQVDLKTIHNWVEKHQIPHFRTPGRHLRFKAADVAAFLRKFGYPMPPKLAALAPVEAPAVDGPTARVVQVFDDSVSLEIRPADMAAFRALEGRDVVLAPASQVA